MYQILGGCLLISSLPGKALGMFVSIARPVQMKRKLGECLLISSVLDKVLRMLVDIGRLAKI